MKKITFLLLALSITTSGCSMLNPYDEKPYCRARDKEGKCIDVIGAYKEASADSSSDPLSGTLQPKHDRTVETSRERYQSAHDLQVASLLQAPKTPLMTPPKVLRVLILPYTSEKDGNQLFMPRYTFIEVEKSKFVLGDYLNK